MYFCPRRREKVEEVRARVAVVELMDGGVGGGGGLLSTIGTRR